MKNQPNPKKILILKSGKQNEQNISFPNDLDLSLLQISGYTSLIREVEFKSLEYGYPFGVSLKTGLVTVNLNKINLPHKVIGYATKALLAFSALAESQLLADLAIQRASVRSSKTCLVLREFEKSFSAKK